MNEIVKATGSASAGYQYQTLYGIKILVDWLENPGLYARVQFDCDDRSVAPLSLDDVVAERMDGKFTFWQVKYTPPDDNRKQPLLVDWEWLLDEGPPSKSKIPYLKKWKESFNKYGREKRERFFLVTNRLPSREFLNNLSGSHINYDKIPFLYKQKIDTLLGGELQAREFFSFLEIQSGTQNFLTLRSSIDQRLFRRGFSEPGVDKLHNLARDWTTLKNTPAPDGWITLEILENMIIGNRPKPMNQDFFIPQHYSPPNANIHEQILSSIFSPTESPIVLVGAPGRGKSTYLSFLVKELRQTRIPVIRHHYFLSLSDHEHDRWTPYKVANSLLHQIEMLYPDARADTSKPEKLLSALNTCAAFYKEKGCPFVVVLDGLDHIRRDGGDHDALDFILSQIIPGIDNLVLILGTQNIYEQLPERLLRLSPKEQWVEMPPMSATAILQYIKVQIEKKRWRTDGFGNTADESLAEIASDLLNLTYGHPLHLIFSIEELLLNTSHPFSSSIKQLGACPKGDIREYYKSLWRSKSDYEKDVLHLICEYPFLWPRSAFKNIPHIGNSESLSIRGIEHLLSETDEGFRPFHDSIAVFVKEQSSHKEAVLRLSPGVENWLEKHASNFIKFSWLWIIQATNGRPNIIRENLTRDWVLDRLRDGLPCESIARLLSVAEGLAWRDHNYGEAYRHQHLRKRVSFGIRPNMEESGFAALLLTPEISFIENAYDSAHTLGFKEKNSLALALLLRGQEKSGESLYRNCMNQWLLDSDVFGARPHHVLLDEVTPLFSAGAIIGAPEPARFLSLGGAPRSLAKTVCYFWRKNGHTTELLDILNAPDAEESTKSIAEEALAHAFIFDGIDVPRITNPSAFNHNIFCIAIFSAENKFISPPIPFESLKEKYDASRHWDNDRDSESTFRIWFYHELTCFFQNSKRHPTTTPLMLEERPFFKLILPILSSLAQFVGQRIKDKKLISFSDPFIYLDNSSMPRGIPEHAKGFQAFKTAISQISIEMAAWSGRRLGLQSDISAQEVTILTGNQWVPHERLPAIVSELAYPAFSKQVAMDFINKGPDELLSSSLDGWTLVERMLHLRKLAALYEFSAKERDIARLAWDLNIGYTPRKDALMDDALDAIENLGAVDPTDAKKNLIDVYGSILATSTYTEGEGRDFNEFANTLLNKLTPSKAVLFEDTNERQEGTLISSWQKTPLHLFFSPGGGGFPGQPHFYPPESFFDLLDDISALTNDEAKVLPQWYGYWSAHGQEIALLRIISSAFLTGKVPAHKIQSIFQYLLETSAAFEGNSKRFFDIAVKIQIETGGWGSGWMTVEDYRSAQKRLLLISQKIGKRVDDFIRESSKDFIAHRNGRDELYAPGSRLVYFLCQVGKIEEARSLTSAIASCAQDDLRNLRPQKPPWLIDEENRIKAANGLVRPKQPQSKI